MPPKTRRKREIYRCRGCLEQVWSAVAWEPKSDRVFTHCETGHERRDVEDDDDGGYWNDVHSDDVLFEAPLNNYDCNWTCNYDEVYATSC